MKTKRQAVLGLPPTVAFTTERLWLPLPRNSLAFLFVHGHGDLGASIQCQIILNWGQSRGKKVQKPAKYRKNHTQV